MILLSQLESMVSRVTSVTIWRIVLRVTCLSTLQSSRTMIGTRLLTKVILRLTLIIRRKVIILFVRTRSLTLAKKLLFFIVILKIRTTIGLSFFTFRIGHVLLVLKIAFVFPPIRLCALKVLVIRQLLSRRLMGGIVFSLLRIESRVRLLQLMVIVPSITTWLNLMMSNLFARKLFRANALVGLRVTPPTPRRLAGSRLKAPLKMFPKLTVPHATMRLLLFLFTSLRARPVNGFRLLRCRVLSLLLRSFHWRWRYRR